MACAWLFSDNIIVPGKVDLTDQEDKKSLLYGQFVSTSIRINDSADLIKETTDMYECTGKEDSAMLTVY